MNIDDLCTADRQQIDMVNELALSANRIVTTIDTVADMWDGTTEEARSMVLADCLSGSVAIIRELLGIVSDLVERSLIANKAICSTAEFTEAVNEEVIALKMSTQHSFGEARRYIDTKTRTTETGDENKTPVCGCGCEAGE